LIICLLLSVHAIAQEPTMRKIQNLGNRFNNPGNRLGTTGGTIDSIRHRNKFEDSITISFRYLDSARSYPLDSTIRDFTKRFPIPATNIYLGNTGNASRSILFSPVFKAGWDAGFHAFDIYKWKWENVRFFNTTRPYTELNYLLGLRVEQIIEILHTQNIRPNWNASFQYRLINSPGFFKNQKTNHNNYLFTSWYQSKNKRYNNYFVIVANRLNSGESGGLMNDQDYLNDPAYKDRFNIPTRIGGDPSFGRNFFSTIIPTGNKYSETRFLLRQQYDLGKKDSLVTDSTVIPLFYPSLRFEHTFQFSKYSYLFTDAVPDSAYYRIYYDTVISNPYDTFRVNETWKEMLNDFSIYQFPDVKNLQQFIKIGAALQNLSGEFSSGKKKFYNIYGHIEYRNKTRNQKWDAEINGKLYFTGLNAGDYQAYGSLQRYAGKRIGYVQMGFENSNRTPSFIFDNRSSFYLLHSSRNFKKENSSHFFGSLFQPAAKLKLSGHYYVLTNYSYITNYYQLQQETSLFNVLQVSLEKTLKIGKHWNWHAEIYFQQTVGNAPVNLPLIFTRNRFAYEGNLGFKNLDIAMGLEARYHTPYKADGYSPVLGQFFYQDSIRISNSTPDISAYLHFRIRSFKAFVRAENLNTARVLNGQFGFTRNNFALPGYPYPGLQLRLGIYWSFVN
jgi:hypothetical protein